MPRIADIEDSVTANGTILGCGMQAGPLAMTPANTPANTPASSPDLPTLANTSIGYEAPTISQAGNPNVNNRSEALPLTPVDTDIDSISDSAVQSPENESPRPLLAYSPSPEAWSPREDARDGPNSTLLRPDLEDESTASAGKLPSSAREDMMQLADSATRLGESPRISLPQNRRRTHAEDRRVDPKSMSAEPSTNDAFQEANPRWRESWRASGTTITPFSELEKMLKLQDESAEEGSTTQQC